MYVNNDILLTINPQIITVGTLQKNEPSLDCIAKCGINMALIALLFIISAGFIAPGALAANLLFKSSFGPGVSLGPIIISSNKLAWEPIIGTDSETGFSWPIEALGARFTGTEIKTSVPFTAETLGNYATNEIRQTTGPHGDPVNQLSQTIHSKGPVGAWDARSPLRVERPWTIGDTGDLYISYWFKHPADLADRLDNQVSGGASMSQFAFKTGGYQNTWRGDYRFISFIVKDEDGSLFWKTKSDNHANAGLKVKEYWQTENKIVAVPVGKWFRYEVFIHRSNGMDGRLWVAVNGRIIADQRGANMGDSNLPITRLSLTGNYSGGYAPVEGKITDLKIWDGFPCGEGLPCYGRCGVVSP